MKSKEMSVKFVIKQLLDVVDLEFPLDFVMITGDCNNEVFKGDIKIGSEGVIFLNGEFVKDLNEDFIDYANWEEI